MELISSILFWLITAVLTAIVLFVIVLYIRGAFRWRAIVHIENAIAPQSQDFLPALKSLSKSIETQGEIIDFWGTSAEIQQARIEAIENAQTSIQFETFIMTPGDRTQNLAAALSRKAHEGVNVQILIDSLGCRSMSSKYWHRLRAAGVTVIHYNPFDWRAPVNFSGRTHRKLLIIDGQKVLIGGAGISDLWDGIEKSDDTQPWLDIEVALTGEVVGTLAACFEMHWQGHRRGDQVTGIDMNKIYPESAQTSRAQASKEALAKRQKKEDTVPILVTPGTKPSYRNSSIENTKEILIACARKRIWLSSPYFLPNQSSRQLLISAKRAGIDVRILTTSDRSDKKPVYYASYEVYGPLLEVGIQIFEFQPSMLHAKMLIIDDEWVNTGSANFDYRSFLHNDELDILVKSPQLVKSVEQIFKRGFSQSQQIGLHQWKRRSILKHRMLGNAVRLVQWQL
ncbi:MAG: phosphatidylserine/phosphatidylglycerophosphate/cardiolipin synthase family protein [Cyanobacteria bacterium J06621_11]